MLYTGFATGAQGTVNLRSHRHGLATLHPSHYGLFELHHDLCILGRLFDGGNVHGRSIGGVSKLLHDTGTKAFRNIDVIGIGATYGNWILRGGVGMLSYECACGNDAEPSTVEELGQLVESTLVVSVAVYYYGNSGGVIAFDIFQSLQCDGSNVSAIDRN